MKNTIDKENTTKYFIDKNFSVTYNANTSGKIFHGISTLTEI